MEASIKGKGWVECNYYVTWKAVSSAEVTQELLKRGFKSVEYIGKTNNIRNEGVVKNLKHSALCFVIDYGLE